MARIAFLHKKGPAYVDVPELATFLNSLAGFSSQVMDGAIMVGRRNVHGPQVSIRSAGSCYLKAESSGVGTDMLLKDVLDEMKKMGFEVYG